MGSTATGDTFLFIFSCSFSSYTLYRHAQTLLLCMARNPDLQQKEIKYKLWRGQYYKQLNLKLNCNAMYTFSPRGSPLLKHPL